MEYKTVVDKSFKKCYYQIDTVYIFYIFFFIVFEARYFEIHITNSMTIHTTSPYI